MTHNILIGGKYNQLTVLAIGPSRSNGRYWQCICDCGKPTLVCGTHLASGRAQSCGCAIYAHHLDRRTLSNEEAAKKRIYTIYTQKAKKRHIPFTITWLDFLALIAQNCYYCDATPSNEINIVVADRVLHAIYNGIDRLDNNKGYEADNCVPCCKRCNIAKADMTMVQFIALCKRIAERF